MKRAKRLGLFLVLVGALAVGGCFLFPNLPPEAAFDPIFNTDPDDPLVVVLDASASSSPDGDEIEAYMWTFGEDVTILTPLDVTKTVAVPVITVKYPLEGTYTVTLVVREKPRQEGEPGKVSAPVSHPVILPPE